MTLDKNKKITLLSPWWKGFLTSILGTTISIALTFGTTTLVNNKKKRDSQRQTAMMLNHDIDESVTVLEVMAEGEERQKSAVQYVLDHFDQLESLPVDTLYTAMTMLGSIFPDEKYFDDSKEKVFNSSQDTW